MCARQVCTVGAMGRCNGGGGRNHGGGGFQEGQKTGAKSGKASHGKTGGHDARGSQREQQKRDKNGLPLNFGPYRNGYYVGNGKSAGAAAERVGLGEESLNLVSSLLRPAAMSCGGSMPSVAPLAAAAHSTSGATARKHGVAPRAASGAMEMSPAQRAESERLLEAHKALREVPAHAAMRRTRESLPAFDCRTELMSALDTSQSLIVCGETGCGKSTQVRRPPSTRTPNSRTRCHAQSPCARWPTCFAHVQSHAALRHEQVPQYILEAAVEQGRGAACTVLIAQPRRVAAVSLAERVAAERAEAVGGSVGYSIRHEAVSNRASTRLLFCTTGVILRRLQVMRCA